MLIKEYFWGNWPPLITVGVRKTTILRKAGLADVVMDVQNRSPGELEIRLRRATYFEYIVFLHVDPSLQQKIILDIVRKRNMTLREFGELPVS